MHVATEAGLLLATPLLAGCGSAPERPNALLVVIDTLRRTIWEPTVILSTRARTSIGSQPMSLGLDLLEYFK